MTNSVISKMVDGHEKGFKQVLHSPTRGKGKQFFPNSSNINTNSPGRKDYSFQRHQKAAVPCKSPRSSPQHDVFSEFGNRSPQQKVSKCSPSKGGSGQRNVRSPRLSPNHGELYAGFSDSPEPTALPQPPSHWIFPILVEAQA